MLLRVLQKSEIANRVKIMHKAATGLIQARFESKEPPKVLLYLLPTNTCIATGMICFIDKRLASANVGCN